MLTLNLLIAIQHLKSTFKAISTKPFAVKLVTILLWVNCVSTPQASAVPQGEVTSVIEGTLTQISKLPQPENNPYPNCYYTAIVDIEHIVSGGSLPKRIVVVLPGFFSRKYAPEANFKVGDKIRATVLLFSLMPDEVKQTQQADEIEEVDLPFFFPQNIALIQSFQTKTKAIDIAKKHIQNKEIISFKPLDPGAKNARQETMRRDLEQIDNLLTRHGGDWDRWYESLSGFRKKYKEKYDIKASMWMGDSYFSAGLNEYGKGYSKEFVSSMVAFNKYLAERNVDLVVVRVPQKGEIVDDLFTPAPKAQISNPYLLRMYKELLEADVEVVVDLIPRLKQARMKFPLMYYYQDFAEEHPAEGTAWVLAEMLAERVQRYEQVRKGPHVPLKRGKASLPQTGFKWPAGNPKFNSTQPVSFDSISSDKLNPLLSQGVTSPILVVGSSFIGSPSFERGGNIPAYLAYLTGIVPDVLYREGSNATIPRTIAREGDGFLKNRSVCVFPIVPWAIHSPLDLPPIVNPASREKVLISSYTGNDLRSVVKPSEETPRDVFSYSPEGDLSVQARSKETRMAGDFTLDLPKAVSQYPYFMIAIETKTKDAAAIKVIYGKQSDTVHKSYTQANLEEVFVFKGETSCHTAAFNISNLRSDSPMSIRSIKLYGLR